ncbi:Glycosyltransferase involved in cell wall bisynthesis [Nocardioides alpinus]|uniref:Glycosyltransferase involved in cell wall bisynthesis n=1 Tax=Nocardioides alpinus TaxID=748909 RepID=A0A1I0WJ70_9ACTN|nr:glycosyltransferase [Nocardioides alpinus]PKH37930.1 hypothetical protein CXG46_21345 [Nocardioides alpinus]SFA88043.1 Glycosyltransferase involved in cell wall bisynthesis [Nocardioides alpinus]
MKVVVLAPAYVPAHKAGGPVPGIVGAVDSLRDHQVHVLTSDRDLGDTAPYPAPHVGTVEVDGTPVTYLPPLSWRARGAWRAALRTVRAADVVYVNSVMSQGFTVLPLVVMALTRWRGRLLVSPRGELAASALALGSPWQKKVWTGLLRVSRSAVRFGGSPTVWVVSSEREQADVTRMFPGARSAVVPERLRPVGSSPAAPRPPRGEQLRVVTVGRVAPVKGIDDLVRGLAHVRTPVRLDVLGLLEDAEHVAVVRTLVDRLPDHVEVRLVGAVGPEQVEEALRTSHLFALLTRGENFGHAIGEALRAGCPVLISDQTPWTYVGASGAGVVLDRAACGSPEAVGAAVQAFADMADAEWDARSAHAASLEATSTASLATVLRELQG